jgi:hypothetical protein
VDYSVQGMPSVRLSSHKAVCMNGSFTTSTTSLWEFWPASYDSSFIQPSSSCDHGPQGKHAFYCQSDLHSISKYVCFPPTCFTHDRPFSSSTPRISSTTISHNTSANGGYCSALLASTVTACCSLPRPPGEVSRSRCVNQPVASKSKTARPSRQPARRFGWFPVSGFRQTNSPVWWCHSTDVLSSWRECEEGTFLCVTRNTNISRPSVCILIVCGPSCSWSCALKS